MERAELATTALGDTSSTYLSTGAGSGGASNCATGAGGADQSSDAHIGPRVPGLRQALLAVGGVAGRGSSCIWAAVRWRARYSRRFDVCRQRGLGALRSSLLVRPGLQLGWVGVLHRRPEHLGRIWRNLGRLSHHGGHSSAGQSKDGRELGQPQSHLLPDRAKRVRRGGRNLPRRLVQLQR